MEYVNYYKQYGKFCYPFIIESFIGKKKGEEAKRRILMSYLAGCVGGFVEIENIPDLLSLISSPV